VIGHRGAAKYAPENTLAGLRKAKELGCLWVEIDVRLTADGQLVLLHDDRLERTTDGRGRVSASPLATVLQHDAGGRFDAGFAGERVPTLEQAVQLLAELGLGANIELKAARGRADKTGATAADLLARLWPSELPAPLISSFLCDALAAARAHVPEIARGLLFRAVPKNWRDLASRLGCATIHADHRRLDRAVIAEIRASGYPLLAYTVNDPWRARALLAWGVTSVFSDDPQRLILDAAAEGGGPAHPTLAEADPAGMPGYGAV
jgi:glycerophosphoryl diester phosphodiesterase